MSKDDAVLVYGVLWKGERTHPGKVVDVGADGVRVEVDLSGDEIVEVGPLPTFDTADAGAAAQEVSRGEGRFFPIYAWPAPVAPSADPAPAPTGGSNG